MTLWQYALHELITEMVPSKCICNKMQPFPRTSPNLFNLITIAWNWLKLNLISWVITVVRSLVQPSPPPHSKDIVKVIRDVGSFCFRKQMASWIGAFGLSPIVSSLARLCSSTAASQPENVLSTGTDCSTVIWVPVETQRGAGCKH